DAPLPAGQCARAGADLRPRGWLEARGGYGASASGLGPAPPPLDRAGGAVINRICRAVLALFLRRISLGSLIVLEAGQRRVYGSGAPVAAIRVHSPRMWRMALRGSRGLADAYAAGLWDS